MKIKKSLIFLLSFFTVGLVGCNETAKPQDEANDSQIRAVYRSYQENGGTLSYDEWLASIKGEPGEDGVSIVSITKASSVGNVDTYVIVYSNGTTSSFTVTNGIDGQSIKGEPGDDGHSPVVTIGENGNWFIDGVDSNKTAIGQNGNDGESAYELYCKYHPEYKGSEEEWINDFFVKESYDFSDYGNLFFTEMIYKGEECYSVSGFFVDDDTVVIPETYKGLPVRSLILTSSHSIINPEAISYNLVLPKNLKVISSEESLYDGVLIFTGSLDYIDYLCVPDRAYFLGSLEEYNTTNLEDHFSNIDIYCWNNISKEYELAIHRSRANELLNNVILFGYTSAERFIDEGFRFENSNYFNIATAYSFFEEDDVVINWDFDRTLFDIYSYTDDGGFNGGVGSKYSTLFPIYPASDEEDIVFNLKITSIIADDVEFTYNELISLYPNKIFNFNLTIHKMSNAYKAMTIEEINSVSDEPITKNEIYYPSTFNIVDYDSINPYFKTDNLSDKYLYVKVKGKMIYTSPDYSFGLLADGDDVIQVYAGVQQNLNVQKFPALFKEYVEIYGTMSQYQGTFQLSSITSIKPIDAKDIDEPTLGYSNLSETYLSSLKITSGGFTYEKQAVEGMMNSLKKVTGIYVQNSLIDSNGNQINDLKSLNYSKGRFSFKLRVGSQEMKICYDYHVDTAYESNVLQSIKTALSQDNPITVLGTVRYENPLGGFVLSEDSCWTLVPFKASQISFEK